MNILFISKLTGKLWAGPNNSVPAQVLAQSKIDNVMWVNLNHVCLPGWRRNEYQFINFDDICNCTLNKLPTPFNKPDYIICEEVYCYLPFDKMLTSIMKSGMPYSIVPRSTLTFKAQQKHALKKKIANFFFYNKFIQKASAIQYLTNFEQNETEKCFKHKSYIIPNGTYLPLEKQKEFCKDGIKIIYIGRLEIYQKGLDILIQAIESINDELRAAEITIGLYGPNRKGTVERLTTFINSKHIDDIVYLKEPVFGVEKEKVLNSSDVFIMTSRFEGMPMGLIEALSHGLPCVVTEGTYLMDEITSFDAGWAAGSSIESIRDALLKLASESELLSIKSSNARKLASHYSWDYLAKVLHKHITDTI